MTESVEGPSRLLDPTLLESFARAIVDGASQQGVQIRVFGGVGVRLHCPEMVDSVLTRRRYKNDIDFVIRGSDVPGLHGLMLASGFSLLRQAHQYRGGEHRTYVRRNGNGVALVCDVYAGRLRFNHAVPGRYFEQQMKYLLPITQLLLSKLSIVEFGESDVVDVAAMVASHEFARTSDPEAIQSRTLMGAWCSGCSGWGLARTCSLNVDTVRVAVEGWTSSGEPAAKRVLERLDCLRTLMRARKSVCWKARAAVGSELLGLQVPWYDHVQPDESACHGDDARDIVDARGESS